MVLGSNHLGLILVHAYGNRVVGSSVLKEPALVKLRQLQRKNAYAGGSAVIGEEAQSSIEDELRHCRRCMSIAP